MVSLQIHYTIQVASEPVFIDDLWDSSGRIFTFPAYCSFTAFPKDLDAKNFTPVNLCRSHINRRHSFLGNKNPREFIKNWGKSQMAA